MTKGSGRIAVALACLLLAAPCGAATGETTLYVDRTADGATDGSSWADAYTHLQDALTAARAGVRIHVAAGVYHPDRGGSAVPGSPAATFRLRSGIALYGGYPPGGAGDRAWRANPTVLSGDIDGNDLTTPGGWVETAGDIRGTNAYRVVTAGGTDASAVLDGFFITAGLATGPPDTDCTRQCGAGMHIGGGSPTLTNLVLIGNRATLEGGGMFVSLGQPAMEDVSFIDNQALAGGGLHLEGAGTPVLVQVRFIANTASLEGGGLNIVFSAPALVNVLFSGNHAGAFGGALVNHGGSPLLVNVTVSGNRARVAGGGIHHRGLNLTLHNSLVWHNLDGSGSGTRRSSIHDVGAAPQIRHSLIQGYSATDFGNVDGTDLAHDPRFVIPIDPDEAPTTAGDLRLGPGSPAIDRGSDALLPAGVDVDLEGNRRVSGTAVDLGAHEAPDGR